MNGAKKSPLEALADALAIPSSYYDLAVSRYESIGSWLQRDASTIAKYDPAVYSQGSFRFGTVNKPIGPKDEYDLDIVCEFKKLSHRDISPHDLKQALGAELKSYATAHGIKEPPYCGRRCWRIDYADQVSFHIDNLPSIPDPGIVETLAKLGVPLEFAKTAIAITCKAHPNYKVISGDWPRSNPAGFAKWFERSFDTVSKLMRVELVEKGLFSSVDEIPTHRIKTPLQRSVQILKRHRDAMFADHGELKPISMIITTLAGHAYEGERDLQAAVEGIVNRMPKFIRTTSPRIPNPVNPAEDFADKWAEDPRLEDAFSRWLFQVSRDLRQLSVVSSLGEFQETARDTFSTHVSSSDIQFTARTVPVAAPTVVVREAPRPWKRL